jgi:uncharacterized protein (TIGR02145 family)
MKAPLIFAAFTLFFLPVGLFAQQSGGNGSDAENCVEMTTILQVLSEWSSGQGGSGASGELECSDILGALEAFESCNAGTTLAPKCGIIGALNYSPWATTNTGCIFPGAFPTTVPCDAPLPVCPEIGPCASECVLMYAGEEYPLVEIGDKCWFAENLRATHFSDGTPIPNEDPQGFPWQASTSALQCIYGNASELAEGVGLLYNGFAVMDGRGLCPVGWHVPSDEEFIALELLLGMAPLAAVAQGWRTGGQGKKLKATPAYVPGWNGSNTSGIGMEPGGYRSGSSGNFLQNAVSGYYYTSSYAAADKLYFRYLYTLNDGVYRGQAPLTSGYSVRCVKD